MIKVKSCGYKGCCIIVEAGCKYMRYERGILFSSTVPTVNIPLHDLNMLAYLEISVGSSYLFMDI